MALATATVFDRVKSHAMTTGLFRTVNTHEPKNAPDKGPHLSLYVVGIRPYAGASGLATTTAVVVLMGRVYLDMITEPQDAIDPTIVATTDKLMGNYTTDNTLGGNVMTVDLLGMTGTQLQAQAGYVDIDQKKFRSMDIQIPVIIADAWTQGS